MTFTALDRRGELPVPYVFGTAAWAEHVFSAPLDLAYRRGRPTERSVVLVNGLPLITEGHERIALYILEHFQLTGVIRRLRGQPFSWLPAGATDLRTPDFLIELNDGQLAIIEVRAHRYIDTERRARFDEERHEAASASVLLLVWTDRDALAKVPRNLFSNLRRTRTVLMPAARIEHLVERVNRKGGSCELHQLLDEGIEPSEVSCCVRHGRLFISLEERLHVDSTVSTNPITDPKRFLLESGYDPAKWWHRLRDRARERR